MNPQEASEKMNALIRQNERDLLIYKLRVHLIILKLYKAPLNRDFAAKGRKLFEHWERLQKEYQDVRTKRLQEIEAIRIALIASGHLQG